MIGGMTMSYVPDVAEDGIVNPDAALAKFDFKIYAPRTIDFGASQYPINLYEVGHE